MASLALAHSQLAARSAVVLAALRSLRTNINPDALLMTKVQQLSELTNVGGYGEVVLVARQTLDKRNAVPFNERLEALQELLDVEPSGPRWAGGHAGQQGGHGAPLGAAAERLRHRHWDGKGASESLLKP